MTDTNAYRQSSTESWRHLWPKQELDRRNPFPASEYTFERRVGGRQPDCLIEGEFEQCRGYIVEFVSDSDQEYVEKTRHALRYGYRIYWVFHVDEVNRVADAEAALSESLRFAPRFGRYDPGMEELDLGVPIGYPMFQYTVRDMAEFEPGELKRAGWLMNRGSDGFYLGAFSVFGQELDLYAFSNQGRLFRCDPALDNDWNWPCRTALQRGVRAGKIERLGPVGGCRPSRLRGND